MSASEPRFQYRIDTDQGCVVTTCSGEFRIPLFVAMLQEIFAAPEVRTDMSYLHDWRQARYSPALDFRSLSGYARVQGELIAGGRQGARVAVVVASEEGFGVARQAIALLEQLAGGGIERRPFLDVEEACAWLGVDPCVLDAPPNRLP